MICYIIFLRNPKYLTFLKWFWYFLCQETYSLYVKYEINRTPPPPGKCQIFRTYRIGAKFHADRFVYIPYMIYYEIIVGNPRLIMHHSTREERCVINGGFPMMLWDRLLMQLNDAKSRGLIISSCNNVTLSHFFFVSPENVR